MKNFGTLFLTLLICLCTYSHAQDKFKIVVSGHAAIDDKNADKKALADALRKAVRQGAGVDIMSESSVSDFELQYDKVFIKSAGYVHSYKVLEQGPENGWCASR